MAFGQGKLPLANTFMLLARQEDIREREREPAKFRPTPSQRATERGKEGARERERGMEGGWGGMGG